MRLQRFVTVLVLFTAAAAIQLSCTGNGKQEERRSFSGIYPHLAYFNNEGECGTGAVVPWADRLWVVTYGPHLPFGSSDKLYEITRDLDMKVFDGSVGGTPANRLVHSESKQLFIGPYVIDSNRHVRVINPSVMPGRLTGSARHLSEPSSSIYTATMEEGLYEINVRTLDVKPLYRDMNRPTAQNNPLLDSVPRADLYGVHGKGLYSGQGVVVYSNNGEASEEASRRPDIESGSLSEWDGKNWKLIRRNQFVEVTGPGGIYGNSDPENDPIWATGWDYKSLIAGVRDKGKWSFYRLPKASYSYDGAHGWNTEWPRIRDIGPTGSPRYLMTMHDMFWEFPSSFSSHSSKGIRPISSYLKVIGDFSRWGDILVFGCDDSANKEFLNKRKVKGEIEGPGQSHSNLWFLSPDMLDKLGPVTAEGAVWLSENVFKGHYSEPFLFAGWKNRICWLKNFGDRVVNVRFECDLKGDNTWVNLKDVRVGPGENTCISFSAGEKGEWIRLVADDSSVLTAHFIYSSGDSRGTTPDPLFEGLSKVNDMKSTGGLLWSLDGNRRKLGIVAGAVDNEKFVPGAYYELDSLMNLVRSDDTITKNRMLKNVAIPAAGIMNDSASVVITDDQGRRWRLPSGDRSYASLGNKSLLRICREVATERDLFSCSGTFYELPAENADGFAKIRPIASHNFRIHDYASYRGMLIMTGIDPVGGKQNEHIITSADGKAAVWAGAIDDLWKLGKPRGEGGPWLNSIVHKDYPSDPYLIGFYDKRTLTLSHNSARPVRFTIEADLAGDGSWMKYSDIDVKPGEARAMLLPESFQARWIRFVAGSDCRATAWLRYE